MPFRFICWLQLWSCGLRRAEVAAAAILNYKGTKYCGENSCSATITEPLHLPTTQYRKTKGPKPRKARKIKWFYFRSAKNKNIFIFVLFFAKRKIKKNRTIPAAPSERQGLLSGRRQTRSRERGFWRGAGRSR